MKASANLAQAMSIIIGSSGELVNLVRSAVRDLTAQALGQLASAGMQRLIGYKPPFEVLSQVRWCLTHAKTFVKFLIVAIGHFGAKIPLLLEAFKTVTNIIPKLDGV